MARKSVDLPTGVELRNGAIRIRFTRDKQRCSETLPYPATPQGIATASRLRDQVVSLNKHGLLDDAKYAELFPNSERTDAAIENTFGEYAQVWLNGRTLVTGTRQNYKHTLNNWWMPLLAHLPLSHITPVLIRKILANTDWPSPGVKWSAMTKLNPIMIAAVNDGLIPKNPLTGMDLPKRPKKKVDPFSEQEVELILAHLHKRNPMLCAYFEFAFFTGMRLSEVLALRWDAINLTKRTAYVCRIVSYGLVEERTKTKKNRYVLLNPRALHALEQARAMIDARSTEDLPFCFPPSKIGKYRASTANLHRGWGDMLKELEMHYRPPYNVRHTYASRCLKVGMKPGFIANQLGHSVQMLLSTYAEWLNDPDDWDEMAKLDVAPKMPQTLHTKEKK